VGVPDFDTSSQVQDYAAVKKVGVPNSRHEMLMVALFKGSPSQFHLAYHRHPEPVELRWVAALSGQWSILEAVIHGR